MRKQLASDPSAPAAPLGEELDELVDLDQLAELLLGHCHTLGLLEQKERLRELVRARAALDQDEYDQALFLLQQAERVAVAQQKLGELIEVRDLVQVLSARSSGRTRAASEQLAHKVEAGLRSFAHAETG